MEIQLQELLDTIKRDGVETARAEADAVIAEANARKKAILDEAAAGNTRLVLEMSDCQALNSTALGVLMRGYANYRGRGGEIKLCGLGKRIKDLFTMTKLIMVFDHHGTEDEAIAAFAEACGVSPR